MPAQIDRLRRFVDDREADLAAAIARAESQGVPAGYVTPDHAREHVLWSLQQGDPPPADLDEAWERRTQTNAIHGDSVLSDFVASLACERHPAHRVAGFDVTAADAALEAIHRRCSDPVEAYLRKHLPDLGSRTSDVVQEAFVRTFMTYWSDEASRRLQGRARLRTLLCRVARHLGLAEIQASAEVGEDFDPGQVAGRTEAPGRDEHEHARLRRAIDDCLGLLPPKRQVVAYMHWMEGRRPSEVADALRMTRPAISNHLTRAKGPLADCLARRGYDLPPEGGAG